ncbi:MAG TPA: MFS transporter [Nitrososphaeraceae archaeon]|nr:MFS transporter [Nitrososphaeraceae archaeon]
MATREHCNNKISSIQYSKVYINLEKLDKANLPAAVTLILARIVYAINWFNIASIFSHIASDFKQDVSLLGLITASFFVGVGTFQVPGGIIAAKQGARKTAIYGITISSSAALLCGISSQLQEIEILRFIVGLGMAFFFGSSVTLITTYLGKGSEGLGVGLLNSAHSIGGIIGLFGWVILAEIIGWRQSFVLSGGLGLVTSLLLVVLSPSKQQENVRGFKIRVSDIKRIIFDKSLFGFGLILLGAQIAWGLPLTFIVFYMEDSLKINSAMAGLVGSLSLMFSLVTAPVFGMIYDRITHVKKLLFFCGLGMSISVAAIGIIENSSALYVVVVSTLLVGIFSSGVFTIVYTASKESYRTRNPYLHSKYETLSVSWVNGLSLFGAFWVPVVFSSIVHHLGYQIAWLLGGIFSILFVLPPILRMERYKD